MATGSGSKSGTTRKGTSTGARTTRSGGTRKRTTSKPLIIDVEADAATKSGSTDTPKTSSTISTKPSGLDDKTAQAAGLSGGPTGKTKADAASDANASKTNSTESEKSAKTSKTADGPVDPIVPPNATDGAPSPFYLFAAGLIGALLALVLMFLATLAGLFSLSDGRVDGQAVALRALEERVQVVEAQEQVNGSGFDAGLLEPLEADIAALRIDLETALAGARDAAPLDVDAALSAALDPLDARLAAVEAELQAALDTFAATDDEDTAPVVAETADPALAASVEDLTADLAALSNALTGVQSAVTALESQLGSVPPETNARLDALDGLVADAGARLGVFGEHVMALVSDVEMLGVQMGTMDEGLIALANAPVAQTPDRLARLGVALDALVTARDAGADVSMSLAAAQGAASFDDQLAAALAPLSSAQLSGALSGLTILATYDDAYDAMRAAAPAAEGGGLLGALEERARQMVTIRAPEGSTLSGGASPSAQLDRLGSLIEAGRFDAALTLANDLPAAMQQASGSLIETLNARVALDDAIANTRQALMAQLSVPASDTNSQ